MRLSEEHLKDLNGFKNLYWKICFKEKFKTFEHRARLTIAFKNAFKRTKKIFVNIIWQKINQIR